MMACNKPKHVAYSICVRCCARLYIRKYTYFISGPTCRLHSQGPLRVYVSLFARKFMVSPPICTFRTFTEAVSANTVVNDIMSGE